MRHTHTHLLLGEGEYKSELACLFHSTVVLRRGNIGPPTGSSGSSVADGGSLRGPAVAVGLRARRDADDGTLMTGRDGSARGWPEGPAGRRWSRA